MRWDRFPRLAGASCLVWLLAMASAALPDLSPPAVRTHAGIGSAATLQARYDAWAEAYERAGRRIVVPLGAIAGLTSQPAAGMQGTIRVDVGTGDVEVEVRGAAAVDAWLVSNAPGSSVAPGHDDTSLRLGTLAPTGGVLRLRAGGVWRDALAYDLVVITPAGFTPAERALAAGLVPLFERVYWAAQTGRLERLAPRRAAATVERAISLFAPALSAQIGPNPNPTTALERLIARGRQSFFSETFNGNGRTCGTCHREDNNLTIDPDVIAMLPSDDPLFVAEFVPALARNFENPLLMRRLGLFLENADGFDDLATKFVMRGVPGLHAMLPNTLRSSTLDETTQPPIERVGWAGDRAPGTGTLREAAIGSIVQYLPRTLGRVPGVDFRLPTAAELDELEAFQKSLGRGADVDISSANRLRFRSPVVEQGRMIFNNPGSFPPFFNGNPVGAGRCLLCHFNAGAGDLVELAVQNFPSPVDLSTVNSSLLTNGNFDTGVEDIPNQPADALVPPSQNPPDGGFGRDPVFRNSEFLGFGNGSVNPANGGLNARTFNTPVLVEAADTGPFFHNNSIATIEGAVAFYSTPAFNTSPIGALIGGINLSVQESDAVAAMLRVLNALENIRSSRDLVARALETMPGQEEIREELVRLSISELDDAIDVLGVAGLHPDAQRRLVRAARLEMRSLDLKPGQADAALRRADRLHAAARAAMVE